MQEKIDKSKKINIADIIENSIYICVVAPLVIIAIYVVFISITKPDIIPDIFGYKTFMILNNNNIEDEINFGDLIVTYNTNKNALKSGDIIAYRNEINTVSITKINKISDDNNKKVFSSKDAKFDEEKIEGLVVKIIPKLGLILYFIQQPLVMLGIGCIISIFGLIWIYIAQELDKIDEKNQLANQAK